MSTNLCKMFQTTKINFRILRVNIWTLDKDFMLIVDFKADVMKYMGFYSKYELQTHRKFS